MLIDRLLNILPGIASLIIRVLLQGTALWALARCWKDIVDVTNISFLRHFLHVELLLQYLHGKIDVSMQQGMLVGFPL